MSEMLLGPVPVCDLAGEPAEFGKNRTLSTADRRHALVQPGLCPIEVHLNLASGGSLDVESE
ncbi:hypothetical protein ALP06_200185 [Pseudomonas coronafaciens pv. atropurpurea]|nr:hypothetical protein ALP06_200185 [Pseudomonas coronafaciens pv. atropurpurea]